MARTLAGKSAIVTGAGGGINLEFARLLLENGVNVLLADLAARPEAQEVLEQYQQIPRAVFLKTDVTSWEDLKQMFDKALEQFGSVDIVCPGAGVFEPPFSSFWYPPGGVESKDDIASNHYKSLEINLTHPIRVTQMAISHFLASTPTPNPSMPKAVIHTVSIAGQAATLSVPLYHASKWGLSGFVHSMAEMEPRFGIRVAGVAPGIVKTPLWTDHEDKARLAMDGDSFQSDFITPQTVARVMLALVNDDEIEELGGRKVKIEGGLILEVGAAHVREVPMFNNSGPALDQPGMNLANPLASKEAVLAKINSPGWGQW